MRTGGDDEGEFEIMHGKIAEPRRRGRDDEKADEILDPVRQVREVWKKHPLVDSQEFDGCRRNAVLLGVKAVTENLDAEINRDRDPGRGEVEKQREVSAEGGDVTEPVLGPEEDDGHGF